jgi:primosomal protein N' (replication factor Y)
VTATPDEQPDLPVARIAVDVSLHHLDRPFDYAVPAELAEQAIPGSRVRVRFSGRLVDGYVLERCSTTDHEGKLAPLAKSVSSEAVLTPEIAGLCRAVADRYAGTLADVLRLAVPPRHARVEKQPATETSLESPPAPDPGTWDRYPGGSSFLTALAAGAAPRAIWTALPGPTWPAEIATAVRATLSGGRGAVVVVADGKDVDRVAAALSDEIGDAFVALTADVGPAERYRRFLRLLRGEIRAVVGTRAAAFAPVRDVGLCVLWDDGDDVHAEPRAPYPHARDVLSLRAHRAGAGALIGGFAPSVEAAALIRQGWAKPLAAPREVVRTVAPAVAGTGGDLDLARDPAARAARLPSLAWNTAREALAGGAPVLVQVPRRGYQPALACQRCRTLARCPACQGPLGRPREDLPPACRWCGRPAADWSCPECEDRTLRAITVGARRTAEELGRSFPGVPVRTSGRDEILRTVDAAPALVVATPGAEPVADGGYGAVLLLDATALLSRPDLRSAEEALRRWTAAAALAKPAPDGGKVVITADARLPVVQSLVRWAPAAYSERELDDRTALGFPPATRMAAVEGSAEAIAGLLDAVRLPPETEELGPVPLDQDRERLLLRVPRAAGNDLAAALHAGQGVRSARKASEQVRVQLDPLQLG